MTGPRGKSQTPPARKAAQIAQALMLRPHTAPELRKAIGVVSHDRNQIQRYLDEFYDLGLLYIESWVRPRHARGMLPRYAWQPSVGQMPDAGPTHVRCDKEAV